jgi:hypothetical protein
MDTKIVRDEKAAIVDYLRAMLTAFCDDRRDRLGQGRCHAGGHKRSDRTRLSGHYNRHFGARTSIHSICGTNSIGGRHGWQLPGSPKAVREGFEGLEEILPHELALLNEKREKE